MEMIDGTQYDFRGREHELRASNFFRDILHDAHEISDILVSDDDADRALQDVLSMAACVESEEDWNAACKHLLNDPLLFSLVHSVRRLRLHMSRVAWQRAERRAE